MRKIIFWNIAGINNNNKEFWVYISKYDLICLEETWIEEKG